MSLSLSRASVLLLVISACRDAPLPEIQAPTLVASEETRELGHHKRIDVGEAMAWRVSWKGMPIGTAEFQIVEHEGRLQARSRFATTGIAEELRPQRHHMTTDIAQESLDIHAALARIRHWARAGARAAELQVEHRGQRYRLMLAQPQIDHSLEVASLRIEVEAQGRESVIYMTAWISNDDRRSLLQLDLRHKGKAVRAQLVSR